MAKLTTFTDSEQLTLDDALAEFRAPFPPEVAATVQIGLDLELLEDVSGVKIGPVSHNGTCPHTQQCEAKRRRLPHYRPGHPCHWQAWGDWRRCSIYQNGGNRQ